MADKSGDAQERTLRARVRQMISEPQLSDEHLQAFIGRALDQTNTYVRLLHRQQILLVVVAVVFEILSRGSATEVEIFGIKLQELDLLKIFIPVGASYLWASTISSYVATFIWTRAIIAIYQERYPAVYESGLIELLTPSTLPISVTTEFELIEGDDADSPLVSTAVVGYFAVLILAPIAFFVYAFVRLFMSEGFDNLFVWVSLLSVLYLSALSLWQASKLYAASDV
jgi:hypothetical protein